MATDLPPHYRERACGVILAAAVGDALGWPQELRSNIVGGQKARDVPPQASFRAWNRNSGTQYARYQETVEAGEYSDDTQLLLATARACLAGERWIQHLSWVELPAWTLYPRGAGRAVITAARSWAAGLPPWIEPGSSRRSADPVAAYFGAGANGVAMRIAPHVIITIIRDADEMLSRIAVDGIATHGHPRAIVGAMIYALALRHILSRRGVLEYGGLIEAILDDRSWQEVDIFASAVPSAWASAFEKASPTPLKVAWDRTAAETRELLAIAQHSLARAALANDDRTLESLGCYDKTRNGSGTITAVAAAYLAARSASRPMNGLLQAAFLPNADTDTLGSMTASLLGAVHGTRWLGELAGAVQDASYVEAAGLQLAMAVTPLAEDESPSRKPSQEEIRVTSGDLQQFRDRAFADGPPPIRFVDGRRIKQSHYSELRASGRVTVNRLRLAFEDGQTAILDKANRNSPQDAHQASSSVEFRGRAPSQPGRAREHLAGSIEITLQVRNLSESLRFYRDVLGLRVHSRSAVTVSFSNGLALAEDKGVLFSSPRREFGDVLITVKLADFDDAIRRIRSSGLAARTGTSGLEDERQLLVRDPDGHGLKLVSGP